MNFRSQRLDTWRSLCCTFITGVQLRLYVRNRDKSPYFSGGKPESKSARRGGSMNRLLLGVALVMFCSAGLESQQLNSAENGSARTFFPKDTFWGYGQFDLAPPHNEIDPNICRADAGAFGGTAAPCTSFARYMVSGYVEMHPFGRGQFRKFFLFGEPRFLFRRNIPQTLYTWSFDAIGAET